MSLNSHAKYGRCTKCRRRLKSATAACTCDGWEVEFVDGYKIHMYASKASLRQSMYHHYYYLGIKRPQVTAARKQRMASL